MIKKFLAIISIVSIVLLSSCKVSFLTAGASDTSFRSAKIITKQNDTIIGLFKENINDGLIQQLSGKKTKTIKPIELKYIKFKDEKNVFVKLGLEKPKSDTIADYSNVWLEEVVTGEVKLYKKYYQGNDNGLMIMQMQQQQMMMQQQMNMHSFGPNADTYDNIATSSRGNYIYIIRINEGYPEIVEQKVFGGYQKSLSKIFANYPDVLIAIEKYFERSSSIEGFIRMLSTDVGQKYMANKSVIIGK